MLVLTRKQQEKIRIGDGITITILKMKGKAVRLGIEAPMNVPVVRGELLLKSEPPAQADVPLNGGNDSEQPSASLPTLPDQDRPSNCTANNNAVLHRVTRLEADKLRGPLRAMLDSRIGATG